MSEHPGPPAGEGTFESELRVSSDSFLTEVERLSELERQKQRMQPGDEARESTAREIEDIALDLVARSRYQTRLVELQDESIHGANVEPRHPGVVLEEWRVAERRLNAARSAMERAADDADRLRTEHRRSFRRTSDEA